MKRGPGLSSGPQESHQEDRSDDESFDHADPPINILSREEEQMGLWWYIIPGTREDGEDIEPVGTHTWLSQFEHGHISRMKGKGRKGAWHEWQNFLWHQREKS